MTQPIGIEALALAIPRHYLDLEDLARARGVAPEKYTIGLGCRRMAVAEPAEDAVALAATAARRLLESTGLEPNRIGMLIVGTESPVDHAKSVASHVQGLLGLPSAMRVYDMTHACYGGTAALMNAAGWIASGAARGKVALVICADVARYGVNVPGEPTQGAGAVAMLVSDRPRLLSLDWGISGVHSSDVYDFWRPFGHRVPVVDGHYSISCYLEAISGAYGQWRAQARQADILPANGGHLPSESLSRILFHVPFAKMASKAHGQVRLCDLQEAGLEPADPKDPAEQQAAAQFQRQVASSLYLCSEIGNIYTGSLYLSLAGLIHAEGEQVAGQRIGLFSYGSGCASEFFSGVVGQDAPQVIRTADIDGLLARRRRLDMETYHRIMALPADTPFTEAPDPGCFQLAGVEDNRRSYVCGPAPGARERDSETQRLLSVPS